jgi:hypothetical protein
MRLLGYNRRSVYGNGITSLYGGADIPLYRNPEGAEDHDVNTLFFWNSKGKLIAVNINIACPAQEVKTGMQSMPISGMKRALI